MNSLKQRNKDEIGEIYLLGISHKTAPVELREKFSLDAEKIPDFLNRALDRGINEIVYLSTCNRVEVYYTISENKCTVEDLISLMEESSGITWEEVSNAFYRKHGKDVVLHLTSVASSLDSMVLGENEIFGQLKEAYRIAVDADSTGAVLNRLFHHAFNTSKKVKTNTEISKNPLSIAYIAVEQAKKVFDDLSTKNALLIGAGEMGELILKYFTKSNVQDITVANRSLCNAERIVDEINQQARVISIDDLTQAIINADIVISSVTSNDYILTYNDIKSASKKRKGKPIFFVDIAVPRNIDPEAIKLDDIFLFNIDDLKRIADDNLKNRINEVALAREIVESSADEFMQWYAELEIVPIIVSIKDKFDQVRKQELERYRSKKLSGLSDEQFRIVEELTKQIMTKSLHNPIMALKESHSSCSDDEYHRSLKEKTRIIKEIFKHDE